MGFGFRKLPLYQDLKEFAGFIYKLSNRYPKTEMFGLKSQLTRAATSILLNFSEGMMTPSSAERKRFVQIAINSVGEVVAIADLSLDLGYFTSGQHKKIVLESEIVVKRLYGVRRKLR